MASVRQMALPLAGLARQGGIRALNFLFPPLCVSCRARVGEAHALCAACWNAISFTEGPLCSRCGTPFEIDPGTETVCGACLARPHAFARARSLFRYDDAS